MAITDSEFTKWLKDQSAIRCILCEIDGIALDEVNLVDDTGAFLIDDLGNNLVALTDGGGLSTGYLSTVGYIGSVPYLPRIIGGIKFTESLDLNSKASLSFGDIEINNKNGELDHWLNIIWTNKEVSIFVGDVTWDRTDFRSVFSGVIEGIDSKSRDVLNITIRDKLQRLNTPISEDTLGGLSINKDNLLPVLQGECFNITPMLTDEATQEYQIHNGSIESIIEVRDNGYPVSYTPDIANGKFTLIENVYGTITCSAQGDKDFSGGTYINTVANLIENIATNYGNIDKRFTAIDIDTANFSAFDALHQQPVGLFINSRMNVLDAINKLSDSVGSQAVMSRDGELRLLKIDFPVVSTTTDITAYDMKENSLKISGRTSVRAAIKVGYCKNYTTQPDLQTGIPEDHKVFFADEWIYKVVSDTVVADAYKLDTEPTQKDTLLLSDTDAATEAQRLLDIYSAQRTIYEFTGFANLIELELGEHVCLKHNRFNLDGGKNGIVVKLQIDWINFTVKVGVMI